MPYLFIPYHSTPFYLRVFLLLILLLQLLALHVATTVAVAHAADTIYTIVCSFCCQCSCIPVFKCSTFASAILLFLLLVFDICPTEDVVDVCWHCFFSWLWLTFFLFYQNFVIFIHFSPSTKKAFLFAHSQHFYGSNTEAFRLSLQ